MTSVIAVILTGLGLLGAALVMYTKIVQLITVMKEDINHMKIDLAETKAVTRAFPLLSHRVQTLEQRTGIKTEAAFDAE